MSVLNRDEFFNRLNDYVGSDSRDETISFVEDMTDTYNDLDRRNGEENWEQRYNDLDRAWRERYKKRFFSGASNIPDNFDADGDADSDTSAVTIDDLFNKEG